MVTASRYLQTVDPYTKPYAAGTDSPLPPYNIDLKLRLQSESCPAPLTLTERGRKGVTEFGCQC